MKKFDKKIQAFQGLQRFFCYSTVKLPSKYYHPGAIPLLHNVSKANHDALPQVIRNLKKEGYTFGSLYDLVEVNEKDAQK